MTLLFVLIQIVFLQRIALFFFLCYCSFHLLLMRINLTFFWGEFDPNSSLVVSNVTKVVRKRRKAFAFAHNSDEEHQAVISVSPHWLFCHSAMARHETCSSPFLKLILNQSILFSDSILVLLFFLSS